MNASKLKPSFWKRRVLGVFGVFLLRAALWNGTASADSAKDCFFKTSDGVRLHYVEAGKGDRTIVFVPGWMMPASVFDAQVRELSKKHRVVAFDPRSQGKSEVFHGSHSPERRCKDLDELLRAAKADGPILAGWSLGVMEVLDYLAHYNRQLHWRRRLPGRCLRATAQGVLHKASSRAGSRSKSGLPEALHPWADKEADGAGHV
jgi:pimeloyl-ACP methyl ester carboxylesterase